MKMSSLKNEFDLFDEDFDLDETTINENIGIDPDKISRMVMQSITDDSLKIKRRKFITVFLVAAVLSTVVLCSTVIATTGVLRPDFTDVYKGDVSALEIRGTEEFDFDPLDMNLQAEFIGMVNTEDKIVASVELRKKDGSIFTDADGIQNPDGYLLDKLLPSEKHNNAAEPVNYPEILKAQQYEYDYPYVFYVENEEGNVCEQSADAVEYVLSDDGKTMKMYITTGCVDENFSGGYVTITSRYTKTYSYQKKLKAFNTLDETTYADAKYFCQMDGYDMDKDCKWKIAGGQYALYSIKSNRLALPFDMRFKIDYQKTDRIEETLNNTNAPAVIKSNEQAEMIIFPTKICIESEKKMTVDEINQRQAAYVSLTEEDMCTEDNCDILYPEYVSVFSGNEAHELCSYDDIIYENSKLLMTDGSVLYFIMTESEMNYETASDNTVQIVEKKTLSYSPHFINEKINSIKADEVLRIFKTTVIDPQKIAKVIINGDTVYTQSGFESMPVPATDNYIEYTPDDFYDETSIVETPDDKDYIPDMIKYEPVEKTSNEIRYVLQQYTEEHSLLLTAVNTDINTKSEDDPSFAINRANFTVEGSKENLKEFLLHLLKEEQHNMFIVSANLSVNDDGNDNRELTVSIENPFVAADAYVIEEKVFSYVISRWGTLQRSTPIEKFFETEIKFEKPYLKLTVSQADFSKKETSVYSNIFSDTNHKPAKKIDIEGYTFKKWSDKSLHTLSRKYGKNGDDSTVFRDIADEDNLLFRSTAMNLVISGTQQKIIRTLQQLQQLEKENLFITSVYIFSRDNSRSEYDAEIRLTNPYPAESTYIKDADRTDYILQHYGSVLWDKVIGKYFVVIESNSVSAEFSIAVDKETDSPVIRADIWASFSTYDDIAEYKDTINRNPYFNVTNSMNVQRIHYSALQEDYLSANFTLITTAFIR